MLYNFDTVLRCICVCNNWSDFFCEGHSLGAAVAVLVGCLIRPKYPDLKVYALCSPGKRHYLWLVSLITVSVFTYLMTLPGL
jgi:hypothetical protein